MDIEELEKLEASLEAKEEVKEERRKKLYLHVSENDIDEGWTSAIYVEQNATAEDLVRAVQKAVVEDVERSGSPTSLLPIVASSFELWLADEMMHPVQKLSSPGDVSSVEDRSDVLLVPVTTAKPHRKPTNAASAVSKSASLSSPSLGRNLTAKKAPEAQEAQGGAAPTTATSGSVIQQSRMESASQALAAGSQPAGDKQASASVIEDIYKRAFQARDFAEKDNLRKARDMFSVLMEQLPGEEGRMPAASFLALKQACHQQMGIVLLKSKNYVRAARELDEAYTAAKTASKLAGQDAAELPTLRMLAGEVRFRMGRPAMALPYFTEALGLLPRGGKKFAGETDDQKNLRLLISTWTARALLISGEGSRGAGIAMLEEVIHEDAHFGAGLVHYAQIAANCGQSVQAIAHMLRALVSCSTKRGMASDETKKLAGKLLTDVANATGGVKHLLKELGGARTNPQAIMYLANVLKDHGGVTACIRLTKEAIELSSQKPTLSHMYSSQVLGLAHSHECLFQYGKAFAVIKNFLVKHKDKTLGGTPISRFLEAIRGIDDLSDPRLRWGTHPHAAKFVKVLDVQDTEDIQVRVEGKDAPARAKSAGEPSGDDDEADVAVTSKYSESELDILGLLFTMVKVLFVRGALQPLPALISLLEPLRKDRDLHLTLMRNEHAYYSCIAQLTSRMGSLPSPPSKEAGSRRPIYVIGDSHCLPSAWQTIQLPAASVGPRAGHRALGGAGGVASGSSKKRNKKKRKGGGKSAPKANAAAANGAVSGGVDVEAELIPRLVTGLKCWHMREQCDFYPKVNFQTALEHIPDGSIAIFNFGEIDCREGLFFAVEKCKYETVEEGLLLCVDIYVKCLTKIAHRKNLTIFAHPVAPVLDVTRNTVRLFNKHLKKALETHKTLKMLDFESSLIECTGFNQKYALDGTHLSPSYVKDLLVPSLRRHF